MRSLPYLLLILLLTTLQLTAQDTPSKANSLEAILKNYHTQQASPKELESINSIRITGEAEFANGEKAKLTLIKKRPNKQRITLSYPDKTITQAYNVEVVWAKMGSSEPFVLQGDEYSNFILGSPLFHHLIDPDELHTQMSYLGKAFVRTTPVHHILAQLDSGHSVEYFLNDKNFQEEKITFIIKNQYPSRSTLFSDFRPVGPMKQAYKLENYTGNQLESTITLNNVEFNVGVLDSYFNLPKDSSSKAILNK